MTLLHRELEACDKRCKRISKACGLENNQLIEYAMEETEKVLAYIKELKDKENDQ